MTSDVKGYVVRVNFEGHEDWICRISGNLCPCVKEERTLFTLRDAIEASKMPKAPAVAAIFRVYADGREERLPDLAEALAEIERLTAEREEARDWVRRLTNTARVLTCAFCGMAYPPGTPESNDAALTAHGRVCPKHPMRETEAEIERLRRLAADVCSDYTEEGEIKGPLSLRINRLRVALASVAPTDPLAALEAAERRLLVSERWTPGDRGFWTDPDDGTQWPKAGALEFVRRKLAAKKGGTQ